MVLVILNTNPPQLTTPHDSTSAHNSTRLHLSSQLHTSGCLPCTALLFSPKYFQHVLAKPQRRADHHTGHNQNAVDSSEKMQRQHGHLLRWFLCFPQIILSLLDSLQTASYKSHEVRVHEDKYAEVAHCFTSCAFSCCTLASCALSTSLHSTVDQSPSPR